MSSEDSFYNDNQIKQNKKKGSLKKNISKDKSQKGKKSEKGKPKGLSQITITQPNIWASNPIILDLLAYLLKQGRHINLHLAGTTHIAQSNQRQQRLDYIQQQQQQIRNQKPLYDFLEDFSKQHLKISCATRCVVFFIRNNIESKPIYRNLFYLETSEWRKILKDMYFLLDEKFYEEFQFILYHLERNVDPEEIATILIEKAVNLKDSPQILQNLFVQLFLEKIILFNEVINYSKNEFESLFFNSITIHKERISQFIHNISTIMRKSTQMQYEVAHEMREVSSVEMMGDVHENDDPLFIYDD